MDPLIGSLTRIRRRLVGVRAVEAGLAGLVIAAAPALALATLRIVAPHVLPAPWAHPAAAIAMLPCGFLAAFVVRYLAGATLHQAARAADRAAGLHDRLATAIDVLERNAGGTLDARLLADARHVASGLDAGGLCLWRSVGRRGRAALAVAVALGGLALVPSMAGPPVDRPSAHRAAEALAPLASDDAVAPAVRDAIERAVDRLRRAGARRRDVDRATEAILKAAAQARRAREQAATVLASAEADEVRRMVRAAGTGDGAGASAAAEDLAGRLAADAASGGLMPESRGRLADTFDTAGPHAREGGLLDLDRALTGAADAVRAADADRTGAALSEVAIAMARGLGPEGGATVAVGVEAARRARRALGLPPVPQGAAAPAVAAAGGSENGTPGANGGAPAPLTAAGDVTAGGEGAAAGTVPDAVRPEDRDVVRRYFGG